MVHSPEASPLDISTLLVQKKVIVSLNAVLLLFNDQFMIRRMDSFDICVVAWG